MAFLVATFRILRLEIGLMVMITGDQWTNRSSQLMKSTELLPLIELHKGRL